MVGVKKKEDQCCSRYGICMKLLVISLLCLLGLTFMMMMDSPGSLQHSTMTQFNVTAFEFSLLYSMGSWPNAFCLLAGLVIDRYLGVSLGSIIFLSISCFGNILYIVGAFKKTYWLLVLARLLFGFGGEATSLVCNAYIHLWFPVKGTNFVFGIAKSIPWLGSALVFQTSHRILQSLRNSNFNEWDSFTFTTAIMMSVIFLCLFSAVLLSLISRPLLKQQRHITEDMFQIKVKDLNKFPIKFWVLIITSGLVMNSCFNFILMAQVFYINIYSLDVNNSNNIISSFGVFTCIFVPLFGYIVDKIGRNLTFITLSTFGALTAHLLYLMVHVNPFLPTIILSCSLSMMLGSCLSAYSIIVKDQHANSAYGVVQTVTSAFYASGILIVGKIITVYDYMGGEIFYCICLGVALCGCILLWIMDCNDGGKLNTSRRRECATNKVIDKRNLINTVSKLVDSQSQTNYGGTIHLSTQPTENLGRKSQWQY